MVEKTKEDIAAEVLGLPDQATCDKLKELEQENLVLRTKVAIYERLIFGKENTDGVL